jgi:predicted transcriptional regulator
LNGKLYICYDIVVYRVRNKIGDNNMNKIGDNNMNKIGDKHLNKIVSILKNNFGGLTITDIVNKTNLSRSAVRTALANLEGGNKVSIKKIGMAKVYTLKR